jgi:hypothetical protein
MRILFSLIVFMMIAAPSYAEDKPKKEETPITEWLEAESAVVEGLDQQGKETYFILRNKYGVIRAVRVVKRDVGNAVQKCGQANPDIQDKMNTRFKDWSNNIDPILKTAEAYLEREIKQQTVVSEDTFEDMLDLNDEAFEYQEDLIEKEPVSSLEACEKLLKSMDKTESDMLRLMQTILLPESVIREQGKKT